MGQGRETRGGAGGGDAPVALSVVVPVRDEAGNILPLIGEIHDALEGRISFEVIYVDDASGDATAAELAEARAAFPRLRCLRHPRGLGQSAALRTGVRAARGHLIATLDGDGQNDPADLPLLLERIGGDAPAIRGMVAGERRDRHDNLVRRLSSALANGLRRRLLHDGASDTGCGIKIMRRAAFLMLPYFDSMHRFLPALMRREGFEVAFVAVSHRPRLRGRSKYGVANRLWVGLVDLFGVMWLQRRCRGAAADIIEICEVGR